MRCRHAPPVCAQRRLEPSPLLAGHWWWWIPRTPDALHKALECCAALQRAPHAVFGCGGIVASGRRWALAVQLADAVILTDDNPRSESGDAIIAISAPAWCASGHRVRDRESAIGQAVANASAGDVVLVAGKGHETYQIVGDQRRAFSDQLVVRQALGLGAAA
jgi:UDP-N-acetylmuramoyl-L-alanyl-D-glutamate--2,6-diaminopimelate ligase